ncbi:hypothetical protein EB796_007650 [Bugula neritina]|uniref:Uncharacterized protein n=1 Tax=Bugula neritina TaxID=10212 RepID=A0A7J7K901_BUGNE|nr:hypothetical protein EB796_007650 [Bugula neritina]
MDTISLSPAGRTERTRNCHSEFGGRDSSTASAESSDSEYDSGKPTIVHQHSQSQDLLHSKVFPTTDKKQNGKKIPKEHMFIKNLVKQHCSAEDILGVKRRLASQ